MPRRRESLPEDTPSPQRPASTPDDREAQMISLADQLAERQLREGTASSQVITHYLKLGSSRERLEQKKLSVDMELAKAKAEAIKGQEDQAAMFAEAIKAMSSYQGRVMSDSMAGDYDD